MAENVVFRALICAIALAVTPAAHAQVHPSEEMLTLPDSDHVALKAVLHDLCERKVVLLGEAPTHGDGHTAAFKVALVEQLVKRCHFNAVAFESGTYEFIAFSRALRQGTASPAMIADAVGGLWKFDREFQPLIGFLFNAAKDHRLRLAGLDSQLGGLGESYSNEQMVPELTRGMRPEQANACVDAFARHMNWRYPADHP